VSFLVLDVRDRDTHPRCFGKRGCKALKTKKTSAKKRGKRVPFEAQGK
jgi:hypothetical protein